MLLYPRLVPQVVRPGQNIPHRNPVQYPFDRSIYRIQYPERARPTMTLPDGVVPVVDCSEEGLRYVPHAGSLPEMGTVVQGSVKFQSVDAPVAVRGKVIRCQAGEVAIQLEAPGVPRAVIFSEQRFIGKRYPQRLTDGA